MKIYKNNKKIINVVIKLRLMENLQKAFMVVNYMKKVFLLQELEMKDIIQKEFFHKVL